MKKAQMFTRRQTAAFTLIELLVVIAIIGILAGLLLPVLNHAKIVAQKSAAKTEMSGIVTAIKQYETTYNRLPATNNTPTGDFTFGAVAGTGDGQIAGLPAAANIISKNSDIMLILRDVDQGVNAGHLRNPQQLTMLDAKLVSTTNSPGISTIDYQYRDPWGHPYIISLDLNYDDHTSDSFYMRKIVSSQSGKTGRNGLVNVEDASGGTDAFSLSANIMVWSLGPDGKADVTKAANVGVNKDNVLGWQ